jgi:hypothetical protein
MSARHSRNLGFWHRRGERGRCLLGSQRRGGNARGRALDAGFNYRLTKPVEAESIEKLLAQR